MPLRELSDRADQAQELRSFEADVEFRDAEDGSLTFEGTASTVDTSYLVRDALGEYQETIVRGAFTKTLKEKDDVRLLRNHDRNYVFARSKSGTLSLTASPDLRASATLDPANPNVQILRSEMTRGDIDEMSIGFRAVRQEWNPDYTERTIREAKLFDVSVVTAGMAVGLTNASLRSLDESIRSLTETEEWDEPTLRRAIAHLESLLPEIEPEEREESPVDHLALLQDLWAKRVA